MNKIVKLMIALTAVVSAACNELTDLNKNIKNPVVVPAEALFNNGQEKLVDQITRSEVNFNINRLLMQYWTMTTYLDEVRYNFTARNIPEQQWAEIYRSALKPLDEARKFLEATSPASIDVSKGEAIKANRLAIIDVMMVYGYAALVETFGDVPYTEALDADNLLPAYDDGKTIYVDLIRRLGEDIAAFSADEDGFSAGADNIYQGNVGAWKKFAASLKLRLAMTLADVDPAAAQKAAEEAAKAGVFTSNTDNATMDYLPTAPHANPMYEDVVLPARGDYVAAATLVDKLQTLNDPRLKRYFDEIGSKKDAGYKGGVVGTSNVFDQFSPPNSSTVIKADYACPILTYSAVEFLLAEAVERGYGVGGTAASHYEKAITASITEWGGTEAEATAYLGQPGVAYATAPGNWQQKIGDQAWLALYSQPFDAWWFKRRLDYPQLALPVNAIETSFPTRFFYPIVEQNVNGESRKAAVDAQGIEDNLTSRLFWDTQ